MPFDWAPHLRGGWRGACLVGQGVRLPWACPVFLAGPLPRGVPEGEGLVGGLAGQGVTWLPHNLRHALITAVARRALQASPGAWDNLVAWEARRTPRGRRWAQDNRDYIRWVRERGGARPDAEWWPEGSRGPWAVEVDAGRWDPALLAKRAHAWLGLYDGQVWVTLSPHRASVLGGRLLEVGIPRRPVRLLVVRNWWEGLDCEEVW
jgi:hypothetical protein